MARPIGPVAVLTVAVLFVAQPAPAQFGSIFGDPPPRPPANVPGGRSPPPQQPYYPGRDEPPSQPLPAPMSLPPSNRPGAGGVQSQPLPPPPGGIVAPAPPPGQVPQGTAVAPGQPTPLPPGPGSPRNAPQPANTAPQPSDEVVVAPSPQRINNPTAVFSGLDKITGRIISFDVAINETVQFGALQVTPRVCYSRPPTETPNTDAFVEVDEVTPQGRIKRIFTGWMPAASPGLHAVEHPIYDVGHELQRRSVPRWRTPPDAPSNRRASNSSSNGGRRRHLVCAASAATTAAAFRAAHAAAAAAQLFLFLR
jgi:hypothetical protein